MVRKTKSLFTAPPMLNSPEEWLAPPQAAQLRKTSEATQKIERWRRVHGRKGCQGPPFYRVGRAIRYKLKDVTEFMEKCRVD